MVVVNRKMLKLWRVHHSKKNHKPRIWKIPFNFLIILSPLVTLYEFLYTKFPLFQHYNASISIDVLGLSVVWKSTQPPPSICSLHGGITVIWILKFTCMFDGGWFLLPKLKLIFICGFTSKGIKNILPFPKLALPLLRICHTLFNPKQFLLHKSWVFYKF